MIDRDGKAQNDHFMRFVGEVEKMSEVKLLRYRRIIAEQITIRCLKTLTVDELKKLFSLVNKRLEEYDG